MGGLRPMLTEFDLWVGGFVQNPAPNMSYNEIPANCCLKIYDYQQMVVHTRLILDGQIKLDGQLVLIH